MKLLYLCMTFVVAYCSRLYVDISFTSNITKLMNNYDILLLATIIVNGFDQQQLKPITDIVLQLSSSTKSVNCSINYTIIDDKVIEGHANITDMNKMSNINATVVVYYGGIPIHPSNGYQVISTFSVDNVLMSIDHIFTHSEVVCFFCVYNPLVTNRHGCFAKYTCLNKEGTNGSVLIIRDQINCTDIKFATYTLAVYDINNANKPLQSKPVINPYPITIGISSFTMGNTIQHTSTMVTTKSPAIQTGFAGLVLCVAVMIVVMVVAVSVRNPSKFKRKQIYVCINFDSF